jgi:FlaG/FlaF family flagellin (archaellin)
MRSDKKGISAIVATVLIILITVAAVTIIWAAIIPMIQDTLPDEEAFETRSSVITSGGYTAYDSSTGVLFVQVEQFGNISRLDIIVSNKGTSYTWNYTDVPANNQMKTYEINLTDGFAISNLADTVYVTVIPYVPSSSGPDKQGTASGEIEVKSEIVPTPAVACTPDNVGDVCTEQNTLCDITSCINNECVYLTPSEDPDNDVDENCDGFASLTTCGILGTPFMSYKLEGDVTDYSTPLNCFQVDVDDIIIDGNGHVVDGIDGSGTIGFKVVDRDNVTIKNFKISDFYTGIEFSGAANSFIQNVEISSNSYAGISLTGTGPKNNILDSINATENLRGIIISSPSNTLSNINASFNTQYGIYMPHEPDNSLSSSTVCENTLGNILCLSATFTDGGSNTCADACGLTCPTPCP